MRNRNVWTNTGTRVVAAILTGVALLAAGCGKKGGGGPTASCIALSDDGWALFEQKNFAAALGKFNQAKDANQGCAEAFQGLGWSELQADQLEEAITDFLQAIDRGESGPDVYAGLAIAFLDLHQDAPDYALAAGAADSVLAHAPDFVFSHDPTVDFQDMHLIRAQCFYGLADYDSANAEVGVLGGNVQDPESPTFVADLLAEIERLQGEIAGQ